MYSTKVHELQKVPKSRSVSVPFDEMAVDTFGFRREIAENLKAFINQNKKIVITENRTADMESLSSDSSLTVVYPEPAIDVHVPDNQNIPFGFGTSWSENVIHEWLVATLSWGSYNIAKIYAVESIELSGWLDEDLSTDSLDAIVYSIDRAIPQGSYTNNPTMLDWEEKAHWTTYTNSLLQGIAYFHIRGYARKNPSPLKHFIENESFWASGIKYIPKQPK